MLCLLETSTRRPLPYRTRQPHATEHRPACRSDDGGL